MGFIEDKQRVVAQKPKRVGKDTEIPGLTEVAMRLYPAPAGVMSALTSKAAPAHFFINQNEEDEASVVTISSFASTQRDSVPQP